MKFIRKILWLILTLSPTICSIAQDDLEESLSQIEKGTKGGSVQLSDVPNITAYTDKIPSQIKDIINKLSFNNLKVIYDKGNKVAVISADTSIVGVDAEVRIIAGSKISNQTYSDSFKKNVEQLKTLKAIPGKVADWAKQKSTTYVEQADGKVKQAGQGLINKYLKVKVDEEVTKEKEQKEKAPESKGGGILSKLAGYQIGVMIVLPKGFSFEQISKDLKFLDFINFEEMALGLGTGFTDPVYGNVPAGFSLTAKTKIEGPFKTIADFISKIPGIKLDATELTFQGGITQTIGGSTFQFQLPGQLGFKLSDKLIAQTDPIAISLSLLPPITGNIGVGGLAAGIYSGLTVFLKNIDKRLDNLDFKVFFDIDTSLNASVTGMMEGLLNLEGIGLPLKFGNIVLTIGINPENIETLGLSELGMAGELDFGPKGEESKLEAAIDVKLSGQDTNLLVYGNLEPLGRKKDALSLKDIVHLATAAFDKLGVHVGSFDANIPNLGMKHAKFYFSPRSVMFANRLWPSGLNVDVALDLFGVTADVEVSINSSGFEATGYLSPISLGPLKITGAGKAKQCVAYDTCLVACQDTTKAKGIVPISKPGIKTADKNVFTMNDKKIVPDTLKNWTDYSEEKGAILNIYFKPTAANIGMFLSADIELDLGKLGKIKADSCFDISTRGVDVHFDTNVLDTFESQFTLNAKDFKKPTDWYVCASFKQDAIDKLYKIIHSAVQEAQKDLQKGIDQAKMEVEKTKNAYESAFNSAKSKVDDAQSKVDSLKRKLDKAKAECTGSDGGDRKDHKGYPYASPHRFVPEHRVTADYFFLGDIFFDLKPGEQFYSGKLANQEFKFNQNSSSILNSFFTIKELPYKDRKPGDKVLSDRLQKFLNEVAGPHLLFRSPWSHKYTFYSSEQPGPHVNVLIKRDKDIITIFVARPKFESSKEKLDQWGYKIIFDIDKFEKYMTQTYWYNILGDYWNKGLAFGFRVYPRKVNLYDPKVLQNIFNIGILWGNITISPFDSLQKIKEGKQYIKTSYSDLYAIGALKVEELNPNEFKGALIE